MKKASFYAPLVTAGLIVTADQISKALVVAHIPEGSIFARFLGDFVWIIHARNTGAAFSFGAALAPLIRLAMLIVLPVLVLAGGLYYYFRKELSLPLRWALGLIFGGGVGNLIDRIFRPEGVVDFISLKMYGFLGMERFATFNVADSAITIGEIMLIFVLFADEFGKRQKDRAVPPVESSEKQEESGQARS